MKAKWKSQYKDLSFTHPRPLIPQVFILICGLWILSEMLLWNFNCILCELKNAIYRQTCGYRILLYSFSKCLFPCMFYYFFLATFHRFTWLTRQFLLLSYIFSMCFQFLGEYKKSDEIAVWTYAVEMYIFIQFMKFQWYRL